MANGETAAVSRRRGRAGGGGHVGLGLPDGVHPCGGRAPAVRRQEIRRRFRVEPHVPVRLSKGIGEGRPENRRIHRGAAERDVIDAETDRAAARPHRAEARRNVAAIDRVGGEVVPAPAVGSPEVVRGPQRVELAAVHRAAGGSGPLDMSGEEGPEQFIARLPLGELQGGRRVRLGDVGPMQGHEDDVRKFGHHRFHDLFAPEARLGSVLREGLARVVLGQASVVAPGGVVLLVVEAESLETRVLGRLGDVRVVLDHDGPVVEEVRGRAPLDQSEVLFQIREVKARHGGEHAHHRVVAEGDGLHHARRQIHAEIRVAEIDHEPVEGLAFQECDVRAHERGSRDGVPEPARVNE